MVIGGVGGGRGGERDCENTRSHQSTSNNPTHASSLCEISLVSNAKRVKRKGKKIEKEKEIAASGKPKKPDDYYFLNKTSGVYFSIAAHAQNHDQPCGSALQPNSEYVYKVLML